MAKAKTMNRSRNQLATAYAPESFFTFEGGMGACIARSSAGEPIQLSESTIDLVFERMNELGRAWFNAASSARDGDPTKPRIVSAQCVDQALLDPTKTEFQLPGQDRFYLCRPSHMEYTPAPLTFVCRTCRVFQDYETLAELDKDLGNLTPEHCPNPKKKGPCDWEQLDVIFVHWSGRWEAAFPGQWHWSDRDTKVVKRRDNCVCGSYLFKLNRRSAGIGDWFFECAACDKPLSPKWLQNDRDTLRILGPAMGPDRLTEVRMQATPYRASSAYYVKSDLFIDFKDGSQQLLTRLRPGREAELKDFVAKHYGFAAQPITDEDVRKACEGKPECAKDLADYLAAVEQIRTLEGFAEPMRTTLKGAIEMAYSRMESTPILREKRGMDMPVRLNLFPPVKQNDSTRYPVYVVQQGNEAIYVRLKEELVLGWLRSLKCPDMFTLNPGERIGAGLLGAAQQMSPFLDNLPETATPPVYFYLYTLLHSYSHLLMKHVSEYSGLDLGSLGEYIFPADLALVVYRNGTTMDLGNLSALWRNAGTAMLTAMLGSKATQCGTGSLCTERGGACPDCVMMPETSCVAGNKLLSRSVLRSIGGRPRLDKRGAPILGYLDLVKP